MDPLRSALHQRAGPGRAHAGDPRRGHGDPRGSCEIKALPAHFLHSEGNFHFYDPVSRILFSGDMGGSFGPAEDAHRPVQDFDSHVGHMAGFHRRYMSSNKVCRLWVQMVRRLPLAMIVPQHGNRIEGEDLIGRFLEWVENLSCGVDLLTEGHYQVP